MQFGDCLGMIASKFGHKTPECSSPLGSGFGGDGAAKLFDVTSEGRTPGAPYASRQSLHDRARSYTRTTPRLRRFCGLFVVTRLFLNLSFTAPHQLPGGNVEGAAFFAGPGSFGASAFRRARKKHTA